MKLNSSFSWPNSPYRVEFYVRGFIVSSVKMGLSNQKIVDIIIAKQTTLEKHMHNITSRLK